MTKTYTLELKFVLTDEQQQQVIEAARRVYAAGSPSTTYDGAIPRELSAEEFIDSPGSALLHLLDQNTFLEKLDINANEVSHTDPDYDADDDNGVAEDLEEASGGGDTGSIAADDLDDGEKVCIFAGGRMVIFRL